MRAWVLTFALGGGLDMKKAAAAMSAMTLILAGCATNPQETLGTLNQADPKYESQSCLDARNAALAYNDKVMSRVGTGLVLGLLLGPFGIPIAAAVDMNQNDQRKWMNAEMERRCQTGSPVAEAQVQPPAPTPATTPAPVAPPAALTPVSNPAPEPTPPATDPTKSGRDFQHWLDQGHR